MSTVSLSGEVPRGRWPGLVAWLLERRLMARLRYEEGVSYGVRTDVSGCGADLRRVLVSIDALPEQLGRVARGAAEVVQALALDGPTTDELQAWCALLRPAPGDPHAVIPELARLAHDTLMGLPIRSPQSLYDEALALTPDAVRATVADLSPTLLWCVPESIDVPGVECAPEGSTERVRGSQYRPPVGLLQTQYVELSDAGITWVSEGSGEFAVTVQWADCAAVLMYDDGSRMVIGADGYRISLFPERWSRYDELRTELDQLVPMHAWSPQGLAEPRQPPEPPTVEKAVSSSGTWITLAAALLFFGLMLVGVAVDAYQWGAFAVGIVFVGLGCIPVVHVHCRQQRAHVTAKHRRQGEPINHG